VNGLKFPATACNSRSAYFIRLKPVITVNKVEGPKAIEGPKPKVEHPASELRTPPIRRRI
jgi:hypothetical protein